jgi:hypothetical protein
MANKKIYVKLNGTSYSYPNATTASEGYMSASDKSKLDAVPTVSLRTKSSVGDSGWKDNATDDRYVPTMSFMAYWNGAYSGSSSNLAYCNRGAFGTIVTKNAGDYAAASHSHAYLPLSGGSLSGSITFASIGDTGKSAGLSWSGSTDGAGIYYQTTAMDQGNLVLNLTDDDNCYLRIAKSGAFTAYVTPNGAAYFSAVYNAVYNDYAEFFPRGEATEPGDIVALDLTSDHESYIKATATSKIVAGVHSDEYAMLIGGDKVDDGNYVEKNLVNYIPVSLAGRVMCKVTGPVHRGDTIIVSEIPGVGIATDDENIPHKRVVGYVVEGDDRTDIRRVKIRVKG